MLLVAWQRAPAPPPGSWPKMRTSPSQVNPAECPMVTPGTVVEYSWAGSWSDPPSAGSRLQVVNPLPPAQAARMASPRITPVSWQERPAGSNRR